MGQTRLMWLPVPNQTFAFCHGYGSVFGCFHTRHEPNQKLCILSQHRKVDTNDFPKVEQTADSGWELNYRGGFTCRWRENLTFACLPLPWIIWWIWSFVSISKRGLSSCIRVCLSQKVAEFKSTWKYATPLTHVRSLPGSMSLHFVINFGNPIMLWFAAIFGKPLLAAFHCSRKKDVWFLCGVFRQEIHLMTQNLPR